MVALRFFGLMGTIAVFVPRLAFAQPIPDDPEFAKQWALQNTGQEVEGQAGIADADIDALGAWKLFDGAPNLVVAIIGRGIDPHLEFADRLLEGHAIIGDPFNTLDTCPHDTHLAGIIAAATDNALGVAGLHSQASILPVRVLDGCQQGSEASTAEGIVWAVDHGADVILAAVQFFDGTQVLADAVTYALKNNVVLVAPAGSAGNNEVAFPAAFDGCVAVTATTNQDGRSGASNFGDEVDLSAPGKNIWSTWNSDGYGYQLSNRDTASASAFVTGVAALVRSFAPQLSATDVVQVLLDSADDLGDPGWDQYFGFGRINARRALEMTPPPALRFEYVDPLPMTIAPDQTNSFIVRIVGEGVAKGSATLTYRIGVSGFTSTPLTPLDDDLFLVELPPVSCESVLEYFLSAEGIGGAVITDPLNAGKTGHTVLARQTSVLFEDDFEVDREWKTDVEGGDATQGAWTRVVPAPTVGQPPTMGQPPYDRSPDAKSHCYVTGQPQSLPDAMVDVDGGPVRLLSPVIAIGDNEVEVSYARWFYWSGAGTEDFLSVGFSRNGGLSWTVVETVSSTDEWVTHTFRLSDFPDVAGDQLRLLFSTSDEPNDSFTEAAIDEFRVTSISCAVLRGDTNDDGVIDQTDYRLMPDCMTGPAVVHGEDACDAFDFDRNRRIDLADFQAFQRVFEGD